MRRRLLASIAALAIAAQCPAAAQVSPSNPIASPLTAGHCVSASGAWSLQDAGQPCGAGTAGAALAAATPTNPTGTTSTSGVMMGVGGTCKITPLYSSRVLVTVNGILTNSTSGDGAVVYPRYGTGTAPANAASPSGIGIGGASLTATVAAANQDIPFSAGGVVTGLTPGTPYWIDLELVAVTGGTALVTSINCSAIEM